MARRRHLLLLEAGGGVGDGDVLFQATALFPGGDLQDAVDVQGKGGDQGIARRHVAQALDAEGADLDIVEGVRVLALIDIDLDGLLAIVDGVEGLALGDRHRAVLADQGDIGVGVHFPIELGEGAGAEGVGGDIDQDLGDPRPGDDRPLDGRPGGHAQIRVQFGAGLAAQFPLQPPLDQGGAGSAAHQQDLVQVRDPQLGPLHGDLDGGEGLGQVGLDHGLVVLAAQLQTEMHRAVLALQQILLLDAGEGGIGELDLGVLGGAGETRHGLAVAAGIGVALAFEPVHEVIQDAGVEVVAAQAVIAVAGQDLHHVFLHPDHGDIEGAAAEVIDQDVLALRLIHLVGEGGGGGFVDDPHHLQARQLAGVAGGLALGVGKIGRDRDDGLGHGVAQVILGGALEPAQDQGRDLLGAEFLVAQGHPDVLAHAALDGLDGAVGVQDVLVAGGLAHQQAAVVGQSHHGGQEAGILDGDNLGPAVADHGDLGVGGAQVDANDDVAHES